MIIYPQLNRNTVPDRHPIPHDRIQETLDSLGGKRGLVFLTRTKHTIGDLSEREVNTS